MEPKIKDGSWNLFRPCPQGSREGRIVLVQFNSMGDPENGGRFTVKKYHSVKTLSEDAWQHDRIELLPLNPDYDPIPVAPHEGPGNGGGRRMGFLNRLNHGPEQTGHFRHSASSRPLGFPRHHCQIVS